MKKNQKIRKTRIHGEICIPKPNRKIIKKCSQNKKRDETIVQFCDMLGNKVRLRLATLMLANGKICACDLVDALGITPSAISQHLQRMRDAGLVRRTRDGQTIFYSIANAQFKKFLFLISKI